MSPALKVQKTVDKNAKKVKPNWMVRFMVTLMLMLGLFTVAASITFVQTAFEQKPINTYDECINNPKSVVQESYPAICVTKDGQRFVQPLSEEELKLLEIPSDENSESGNAQGKFCGGIVGLLCPEGYTCKLDGNYPDAGGVCQKN